MTEKVLSTWTIQSLNFSDATRDHMSVVIVLDTDALLADIKDDENEAPNKPTSTWQQPTSTARQPHYQAAKLVCR
jgi:hypothetical protein